MIKKFIDNFEEYFCVWSLAIMTILVFIQVVMRYVFQNSLSWSEELARYIFLWLSWVGASYAVKERSHFRVEMFADLLKGKARKIFELFVLLVWFSFCLFLAYQGSMITRHLIIRKQLSAAMEIPMAWAYASVPVGSFLMAARLVVEIRKVLTKQPPREVA